MSNTLAETVYQSLRRDIDTMALPSNEFLVEQAVAERYHVSKAPVRSALHRLCMEGRLISYPRKGYLPVTYTARELQQLQALRLHNERYALELLVREADDAVLDQILAGASDHCTLEENQAFHCSLAQFTGDQFLEHTVRYLAGIASRPLGQRFGDKPESTVLCHHVELARALRARDLEGASAALRADLALLD